MLKNNIIVNVNLHISFTIIKQKTIEIEKKIQKFIL